jgi:chromosome segregation ATPase
MARVTKIDRLETELEIKTRRCNDNDIELDRLRGQLSELQREATARQQEIENRRQQAVIMAARIGVLESDRDRLTTVVEVLARRLMSPTAEHDRSRAGWRALNGTV